MASTSYGAIPSGVIQPLNINSILTQLQVENNIMSKHNSVVLRVTPANGGTVVQVENHPNEVGELYVIDEARDIGVELGNILTMHYLKKENK
jgi:hypothetical protein